MYRKYVELKKSLLRDENLHHGIFHPLRNQHVIKLASRSRFEEEKQTRRRTISW